jgi:hypothetical protein
MSQAASEFHPQLVAAARLAIQQPFADTEALAHLLYERWFASALPGPVPELGPEEVLAHLRAADSAGGRFEPGWIVIHPGDAAHHLDPPASRWQVAAARGSELRWIDPIDIIFADHVGVRPPVGSSIFVSQRCDSIQLLPGWWTSLSPSWPMARPPLVRLYWSVQASRLFDLVAVITACLDSALPCALKCPLDFRRHRSDAVVLYLPVAAWSRAKAGLHAAHDRVSGWLQTQVPALTLQLATGLALAEDPASDSFGMARCRMIANGMSQELLSRQTEEAPLAEAAGIALRSHGLRPDAPYLNPGSTARYTW